PEPEHVVLLIHSLSKVSMHNAKLLDAVAQAVVAQGAAYAPWAPRIAHVYADAGHDHHLLFETFAAIGLQTQGELSLGLWSQLISAFARIGRDSPELCAAASRQASVSVQHTLLQLGQGPQITKALGIKLSPTGRWLSHLDTWHVRVLRELMTNTQTWTPAQERSSHPKGRRGKRKAWWERYQDRKAAIAYQLQQQQQQQQQQDLGHQAGGSWPDLESSTQMHQSEAVGAQNHFHQRAASQDSSSSCQAGRRQLGLIGAQTPVQSSSRPLHAKWQGLHHRQQQRRQQQQEQQQQDVQLQGGGAADRTSVERPKALAGINLRVPAQRLQVVRSLCSLMHGLQIMGHPYDREFMGLACCALKSLCEKQKVDAASPWQVQPLHHHQVAHSLVQAISACAQLRHYDNWLMGEAARLLIHLTSSKSSSGSDGDCSHGMCDLEHTSSATVSRLGLGDDAAKQGAGWLDAQQEDALLLIQLLQAVADLEGPNFHKLLLQQLRSPRGHGQHRPSTAAAQEPAQQGPSNVQLRSQHSHGQPKRHQQWHSSLEQQQQQQQQSLVQNPERTNDQAPMSSPAGSALHTLASASEAGAASFVAEQQMHGGKKGERDVKHQAEEEEEREASWQAEEEKERQARRRQAVEGEREARQRAEKEVEREARQQVALVLGRAVQLLARTQAAFTPHQLCDMLGALALLELCPWREVVHPALCRLAEMCRLKPLKRTAAGGRGPASLALDVVQELIHGGYSRDKLDARQKVQLYQMFLVAQVEGRQGEFIKALGSWDAIRDARATWHAAQPDMPRSMPKVLKRCLESKLQLRGSIMDNFRTQDGGMDVQLCCHHPDTGRLLAFKVLGPEQGLASEISARPLGHVAWLSRCLERRGVDCVFLTWYEYRMAVDFQAALEEWRLKGFAVDPERLPDFRGGLDRLLKKKVAMRMQMPPLHPILSSFPL
ncbi:hypothetical protein DUNSADRAFT_5023, partial [Dunaliella salina]